MAKVRMVDAEPRMVPWIGDRVVEPDEVVEVPDAQFEAYVCQPEVWQPVEEPRGPAAKPAAKAPSAPKPRSDKSGSAAEGGE